MTIALGEKMSEFLKTSAWAGVVLITLFVVGLIGLYLYVRSVNSDLHYVVTNRTEEIVSDVHVVAKDKVYSFGQIKPGETAQIDFSRASEAGPDIRVRFLSGRELVVKEPVYVDSMLPLVARFEIRADQIVLMDADYSNASSPRKSHLVL